MVSVGDKIPSVILQEGQADYGKPEAVDIAALIAGKKGMLHEFYQDRHLSLLPLI
jgi:hypothetical protein